MGSTRIIADTVLTCDEDFSVYSPGAVDIDGDCITWVGSPEDKVAEPERKVKSVGGLLMPGLVNAHANTPMTLVRGASSVAGVN